LHRMFRVWDGADAFGVGLTSFPHMTQSLPFFATLSSSDHDHLGPAHARLNNEMVRRFSLRGISRDRQQEALVAGVKENTALRTPSSVM
jgi:hypothetical protein